MLNKCEIFNIQVYDCVRTQYQSDLLFSLYTHIDVMLIGVILWVLLPHHTLPTEATHRIHLVLFLKCLRKYCDTYIANKSVIEGVNLRP